METVKTIVSRGDKHRIDIERSETGLYRYVTFNDRYRTDEDFHNPPYWMIEAFSGLYETAEEAEADAKAELPWLRE